MDYKTKNVLPFTNSMTKRINGCVSSNSCITCAIEEQIIINKVDLVHLRWMLFFFHTFTNRKNVFAFAINYLNNYK